MAAISQLKGGCRLRDRGKHFQVKAKEGFWVTFGVLSLVLRETSTLAAQRFDGSLRSRCQHNTDLSGALVNLLQSADVHIADGGPTGFPRKRKGDRSFSR